MRAAVLVGSLRETRTRFSVFRWRSRREVLQPERSEIVDHPRDGWSAFVRRAVSRHERDQRQACVAYGGATPRTGAGRLRAAAVRLNSGKIPQWATERSRA